MSSAAGKKLKVTLVRSTIARQKAHKSCVVGLGLRHLHHSVVLDDTPSIRGMINKVSYMLKCEELG